MLGVHFKSITWWAGLILCAITIGLLGWRRDAGAIEEPGKVIATQVGIFTRLGAEVTLSGNFTNSDGKTQPLREFLRPNLPTVIIPVYYRCPRLCGLTLDGVIALLNELPLSVGKEFTVLAVSFNPAEKSEEAREARAKFAQRLKQNGDSDLGGFEFLVGNQEEVSKLMDDVGFRYLPDGVDFAHSSAVMILTPQGVISQYFTGIQFSPWDVRLALVEASQGKIGNALDHLLLYCFRFDPLQGKYTWAVTGVLRIGGVLTLLCLGAVYGVFVFKGRRRSVT